MSLSRIRVLYYYYIIKSYCLRRWHIRLPYGNAYAIPCSCVDRGDQWLQYEPLVASIGHEFTPYGRGGRHGRLIVD